MTVTLLFLTDLEVHTLVCVTAQPLVTMSTPRTKETRASFVKSNIGHTHFLSGTVPDTSMYCSECARQSRAYNRLSGIVWSDDLPYSSHAEGSVYRSSMSE